MQAPRKQEILLILPPHMQCLLQLSLISLLLSFSSSADSSSVIDYTRRNHIQSKGIIDYAGGTVVIDSSDFIYMANQIDELENTYKQIVLKYLTR
mgnify:CR=1 FL=1